MADDPLFERIPGKFAYSGMDVHHPPDLLPSGKTSLLFNLQPDTENGTLSLRPGIDVVSKVGSGGSGGIAHSAVLLNDQNSSVPYARFVGSGTKLYAENSNVMNLVDSGFTGNPLSLVTYRPNQSTRPWVYVYDRQKQQRYNTNALNGAAGSAQNIGIQSPNQEPSVNRAQPLYKLLANTESASAGGWSGINASTGTIGSPTTGTHVPSGTTVTQILYDSGSSGMACVQPTVTTGNNYLWMTGGASVTIDSEQCFIEEIFPALGSTTIAAVVYDAGTTGNCTIVPTSSLPGLRRNQLLVLNGSVYVRVLNVTSAPDQTYSFRCSTGSTVSVGQSISSPPNFRVWTNTTHGSGSTITGNSISTLFSPTTTGGQMSAVLSGSPASSPLDATQIGGRPISNQDYMHIGLSFDNPQYVTEVHFMIDVDVSGSTPYTNNFLYYVVQQSAFQQTAISGGPTPNTSVSIQTAQLDAINIGVTSQLVGDVITPTQQPPYPIPENPVFTAPSSPQSLNTGGNNWTDVVFKITDMTRVGTDSTRGLNNITNALGILVYVSGGTVNMSVSGWWIGGGYGPDCNFNSQGAQDPPIQWRYRYRNSSTGAISTVSPETRSGEILRRQAAVLSIPNSPDPQVDYIDIERRGGTNPDFHYVASVLQSGTSPTVFTDTITENAAQISPPFQVDCYQPWPTLQPPVSGTATVTGTRVVWVSGAKFNQLWLRGTEIIIGGNTYTLYAPPVSQTVLELEQSVPVTGTVAFQIPEAVAEAQPLYAAWLDEANNRICAVGDAQNPGFMYFSNNDNPDGASDSGYLEIVSPSEPLLNGFYAEGSNYVFTSSSLYRVESTSGGTNPYVSYRLSGVDGMNGPWAFDAQRRMLFWWGPDGIYAYSFGAASENLSALDLYPLFPHAGQQTGTPSVPGLPVSISGNSIYPPDYSQSALLRVCYDEQFVYASYIDTAKQQHTLVYSIAAKGWRRDTYSPPVQQFVREKGIPNPALLALTSDGNLYYVSSTITTDAGNPIQYLTVLPAKDAGDSRALQQWGDLMLDYSATNMSVSVLWDNLLVPGPVPTIPSASNRTQLLVDLAPVPNLYDTGLFHLNISLAISGAGPVFLYEWQPSYTRLPEVTTGRTGSWKTGFSSGYKWVNGVVIHGNTFGQTKNVYIEYDQFGKTAILPIVLNGEQRLPVYFPPFYAHEMRIVAADDIPWIDFNDHEWIGNAEPEYGGSMAVNWTNGGTPHYKFVQGIRLHADTYGQNKIIQIQYEGGVNYGTTITINHNGEEVLPYSWNPPFKAHLMRIVPLDNVPWRYWPDSEWVYELEPEPANYWISQPNSLGQSGYLHVREMWIPFTASVAGGLITAIVDGVATTLAVLPQSTNPVKRYFVCPPLKGLYWQLSVTGTGVQLYERDIEFLVKSWGSTGPYQRVKPFGDVSGGGQQSAARI